ncbi:MAG: DNA polymerase III subunit gamma/tau [Chitinophagales bacterium]|nr:DNA polymerase III subunit gamma/tau [Chitinophagales bacterium]
MSDNYIVSARKYRPQTFDTVVGQAHITTTLKNAIRNNHLAHAYLFCGPRGVGKTTCARILAKTINCETPTADMEACGKCSTCQSFSNHTSFNIFELDAASNNSVDDIRELVNQVRFAPQAGKYKIYIIDEVHMLSASAFNAFLKTLEEPPSYAIFILATTEKHKILPTILSRCQIFDFKRITSDDISTHLHSIATKEGVVAQEAALHVVAQKSEGCMRDALSMFDRIVSFTNGMLTYNNTMEHLNLLDADFYFGLVDHMLAQDVSSTLLQLDSALERGFEGDVILEGLAEHFRNLMLCKDPRMAKLLDVPNEHKAIYHEKANQAPPSFIISALNVVSEAEMNYRNANNKRLHVEMCLIRLCYLLQAMQPGEVKKNTGSVDTLVPTATTPAPPPTPVNEYKAPPAPVQQVQEPTPQPVKKEEPQPAPQQTYTPPAPKANSNGASRRISSNLLDEIDHAVNTALTQKDEKKELTEDVVMQLYEQFKKNMQAANKMMLYAQLTNIKPEFRKPDEVCLISPSVLTDTYAKEHRNEILEYYREQTGIMVRVTTEIQEDEDIIAEQQTKVLSKQDMFDEMVAKNPDLGRLKDSLGLHLDY